ncbi:CCR4-NOT transcription complex subunit 1 isoform X2 [Arctopsyche grandis]|uniref:CCR4-NOT transcription complex subunit 1 isoform X2 n=1 Tax=Arctopsyche grandis TaxID=121162 RepID=UPI00406D81EA
MNLDPLSFCLTQISQLVDALTKKNLKQTGHELAQLVSLHGLEADKQLVKCLVKEASRGLWEIGRAGAGVIHASLLTQQLSALLNHPIRVSILCHAIDRPIPSNHKVHKSSVAPFSQLFRVLKLTTVQEVAFCLALRKSSNIEVASLAHQHLKKRLLDLIQCYLDTDTGRQAEGGGLQDCSPEILQLILVSFVNENFGLAAITKELFLERLRREFPRELVPVILSPLLYPDDTEYPLEEMTSADDMAGSLMKNSLADLVREIGYSFTSSVEECKSNILNLGGRDISSADVARILITMARNPTFSSDNAPLQTPGNFWISRDSIKKDPIGHGSQDSWNVEVFVQALKELFPNLNWTDVVFQLDHPEFLIKDRQGLFLLISALRMGLQISFLTTFPTDLFYRHWTNTEGQMSLITHIIKNPDVFSFGENLYHPVAVDILKLQPESDNKEISNWQSLHLVELLLYLSDRGFYSQVHELFKIPIQLCPDVLFLAILQINIPPTILCQELLQTLIPIFLGNHPNSAIILHHAWHQQGINVKSIIMHAMADWYLRGEQDQSRLSRILDVAQDLKALSHLLNTNSFVFVIDLACLASRREYLKLDKWLTDKIREHGETFILSMVKFLQRRCPQVIGGKISDEQMPKVTQLPQETIATMLSCLHICINNVQPELSEMIMSVSSNCSILLNKGRPTIPAGPRTHRGIDTSFNPSALSGQIFNAPGADTISTLGTNLANMTLGAPGNTSFPLPGSLGPLVTTPGSPSRLITSGPSNSPFTMMPFQHNTNIPNMIIANRGNSVATVADKRINESQILFPEIVQMVSKEIEDEANGFFQRIYNHPPHPTLSIDEVLDMLKKFQESQNKKEREVYSCMLRNLFEEYKFFPQYPEKELHITAQLFGGIIERGLVTSYMALGLALKFVLEALRKPHGSKMFYFGAAALDRFKPRLKDYHKYCEHIRTIDHFFEFPPHLIEYVEYGLQGQEPPSKPQGPIFSSSSFAPPSTPIVTGSTTSLYKPAVSTVPSTASFTTKISTTHTNSRPSIANATNIDTLLVATDREEKITIPPDTIQDKIAFIFNNLSQLNLEAKCKELRDIIGDDYWPWLSQYLVMKRASIELNFHVLYSNFLEFLKVKELCKMVTRETFRNIGVLLRSDKGIANFSDRSLLKNLGHWLGMLTLGRNKPILFVDLDFKGLILEAFHKGQQELLYVVPFVAKVLESCAKSKVFKPPNPWTMSIMNVLAELHQEPDLKLNLKFEIEVLCKNLSVDVTNLKPATYLKDADNLQKIQNQLSNTIKKEATTPVSQTMSTPVPSTVIASTALVPSDEVSRISVTPTMIPGESGMLQIVGIPEPRFNYVDLNVSNTSQFNQYIVINPHLILFQTNPHLKQFVKSAIERSIQDWIHPVVERSIKYALPACEHIIRKDFALDPEDSRMRTSAHHIMRHVTAGLAMTNCREQLAKAINANLISAFVNGLIAPNAQQKEIMETAASVLANDNMELVCAFIQKTSAEKALPELDKRLMNDYELRKSARGENRRYYDTSVLNYHNERMPDRIRLKVGGASESQMAVYEEFARNIPGFAPIKERNTALMVPKPVAPNPLPFPPLVFNQMNQNVYHGGDELSRFIRDAEFVLETMVGVPNITLQIRNMHAILDCLHFIARSQDNLTSYSLLSKAVEGLLEGYTIVGVNSEQLDAINRYKEVHIRALKFLQDSLLGQIWTSKQVTGCLSECRDELRFSNLDAVDALIRANLVNIQQYDVALAQCMDNGNNYMAVAFAMQFVQLYLVNERDSILMTESDLVNTIDVLVRIASHSRQPPEGLASLVKLLRVDQDISNVLGNRPQIAPLSHMHSGVFHARMRDDSWGVSEKIEGLLRDWVNLYHNPAPNREIMKTFNIFVQQLNANGIFKNDEAITQFFRVATQLCIDNVYVLLEEDRINPPDNTQRNKFYHMIDPYVRLVTLLIKNSGDAGNTIPKINLLNKVLTITAHCLIQDHKERGPLFQQLPYYRILIMLFLDLNESEPVLEAINFQLLTAYCHTLHMVQPLVAPGFIYAWLDFVAHRAFIHRMLASTPQQKGWGMYSQLLVDLFKYIKPFLTNTTLLKPISLLYTGILKVLLVLLHDFPEFLCDYHYIFCDEISPNCIQMRNLILSAFPRNMRLPDPFTPNLKFDLLAEISHAPRILANYTALIQPPSFKKDLDSYLEARAPVTFLSELRTIMQISNDPGKKYNVPLMNAVILYVGTQAITYIRSKGQTPSMTTIAHTAHMDIFQNLAVDLDYEGRYIFLNGIGNQLRFPNSHTHYFSCALLYLFAEANSEAIQEQITRMLLERIIVNRPHPWGLLITFIELVKNPTYKFADHDFVHCAPEIEKLCTKENIQAIYTAKESNDTRK